MCLGNRFIWSERVTFMVAHSFNHQYTGVTLQDKMTFKLNEP